MTQDAACSPLPFGVLHARTPSVVPLPMGEGRGGASYSPAGPMPLHSLKRQQANTASTTTIRTAKTDGG